MNYSDINKSKQAFIFELDDVIYPEKDYLFQVYYLFTSVLEYTDLLDAKAATQVMVDAYLAGEKDRAFDILQEKYNVDEKYRANYDNLILTAKLPLKLLLYKSVLDFMQEIVVDRKKIFIVTDGNPIQQLNKIKQTEWHGLEAYLTCYFTYETKPKPATDSVELLMKEHDLQRKDIVIIGATEADSLCAEGCGIDYINVSELIG